MKPTLVLGNVMGTGHPGMGAGWQIPTLEKPTPVARVGGMGQIIIIII